MPTYYTSLRIKVETHKKIVKARAKLESKTGEIHSLEKTVIIAVESLLKQT